MQPTMINSTDTPPLSVQHHTVDGIESLEALQEAVRYVVGRSSLWSSQSECQFKGSAEVLDKIKIPFTLCVTLKSTFRQEGRAKSKYRHRHVRIHMHKLSTWCCARRLVSPFPSFLSLFLFLPFVRRTLFKLPATQSFVVVTMGREEVTAESFQVQEGVDRGQEKSALRM